MKSEKGENKRLLRRGSLFLGAKALDGIEMLRQAKALSAIVAVASMAILSLGGCSLSSTSGNVIYESDEFTVYNDSVRQGGYKAVAVSPYEITTDYHSPVESNISKLLHLRLGTSTPTDTVAMPQPKGWRVDSADVQGPTYRSGQTLVDALYNMALTDLKASQLPDGTYDTELSGDDDWSRDVSYAAYLSLAMLDPYGTWRTLKAKLRDTAYGPIIAQADGTGGSWPVSTDRVVWAIGAWEVYKATGDREILSEALRAIDNTLNIDMRVAWNADYKMMQGEQSCLGRCGQCYPAWMQPKDIFESMSLSTNVLFSEAFRVRDAMLKESASDDVEPLWRGVDRDISNAVNNNLWIPNLGYYSEYLYGGVYPIQSQTTDNLGQALAVIFGVANEEMARSIVSKTPYTPYGISALYPQQSDMKPYHNDAVWPFVQAYWNLAARKAANMPAFEKGFGAMCRAAALFSTDKELFVASTGDYNGTAANADSTLWSAAGMASMVLRCIMGIDMQPNGIRFTPFVPAALSGPKTLTGLKYRDATLTVQVNGTGDRVKSFTINGRAQSQPFLPADAKGPVEIVIEMASNRLPRRDINNQPQAWMPATPNVMWCTSGEGRVKNYVQGLDYDIYLNSNFLQQVSGQAVSITPQTSYTLMDVVPVGQEHYVGFTCRPYEYIPQGALITIPATDMGDTGTRLIRDRKRRKEVIELSVDRNRRIDFTVDAPAAGDYFIDFRYANGAGNPDDGNRCALRMLYVNDAEVGAVVMPQRGYGDWMSTGNSNMLSATLRKGVNRLSLRLDVDNMNVRVNHALIYSVRVIHQ